MADETPHASGVQDLIARIRDRWLGGDLDTLVAKARDLAHDLRNADQTAHP